MTPVEYQYIRKTTTPHSSNTTITTRQNQNSGRKWFQHDRVLTDVHFQARTAIIFDPGKSTAKIALSPHRLPASAL